MEAIFCHRQSVKRAMRRDDFFEWWKRSCFVMFLIFFVCTVLSVWSFFVWAASAASEQECSLDARRAMCPVRYCADKQKFFRKRLARALSSEGFIWMVYCPENAGVFSACFDVRAEMYTRLYQGQNGSVTELCSAKNILKDECLRGCFVHLSQIMPEITREDFYLADVDFSLCGLCDFSSVALRDFLHSCPRFDAQGKDAFCFEDALWSEQLTGDVIASLDSGAENKRLVWRLEDVERFLYVVVQNDRPEKELFLVIPGGGLLRGNVRNHFEGTLQERSVFQHKASGVARVKEGASFSSAQTVLFMRT